MINMIRLKINTTFTLFTYWIVIIIWQTIRPVDNRSLVDILIKLGCFFAICLYGYNRRKFKNARKNIIGLVLFLLTQIVTYVSDSLNLSTAITTVFMFVQILVFLIFLSEAEITVEELKKFGDWIINTVIIMCLYSMLIDTNQFLKVFTGTGSYGSECSSFLYSNHEFALYTATAIVLVIWKFINKTYNNFKSVALILLFAINLMSTYSRTAVLGCIAAIFILVFYYNKKHFAVLCVLASIIAVMVASVPSLNSFVFDRLFKGSYEKSGGLVDQGRADMYTEEIELFLSGNWFQKIFGHGYVSGATGGHDAYLYVLNIGGIVMFVFFILVIVWSFSNAFKCIKYNRSVGSLCLGFVVLACLYMVAQTPILFFSTMDSYFITSIAVLVPFYTLNYLKNGTQEKNSPKNFIGAD